MKGEEIRFLTARALGRLLRRRELAAVEVTRATLDLLDTVGRAHHAIAELTPGLALTQATAADRDLRAGRGGPLCGIPYGAKDLLDTAGIPTRWGTPFYRDRVPTTDATVVQKMRRAGAVLVAKLSMIELAGGGGYRTTNASLDGACLNPWDTTRWSGGSSSGSASAVAAGLIPVSLGSETGGSLVIPAGYCGLTTLRPSFGAVSRAGAMPLSWSMDKIGPLAHTAADCETVFAAIDGPDPHDWSTADRPAVRAVRRPMRAGILRAGLEGEPETAAAFDAALRVMRHLGMTTRTLDVPNHDYYATYSTVLAGEASLAHQELIERSDDNALVDRAQLEGLRRMAKVSLVSYAAAVEERARLASEIRALFRCVDVLLSPTVLTEATRLEEDVLAGRTRRGGYAMLGAIAGIPSVAIPMGFGPAGLPLGITITGPLFAERALLRIAARYQRETTWHDTRPGQAT